ncbi:hypothetical protein KDK95_30280 [Actinospica sp. MGRD01-02]|uniref:Uncharacterized protein n=1 Tax=Actinospica acidithermotolerans TaxID=2828514 RepID=A0A941EHR1_9ACTN|nr:hypothetical protein [Actinospica acidithermotolerans]MBR7830628.1 hypothetical protein [Actinospica acidithermotolerans]
MPFDPADFPPATFHRLIAEAMTGPACFTAALHLQEWIRDLLHAGFAPGALLVHPPAHGQRVFEVADLAGLLTARAEFGSHWPTRTMLGPTRGERWWASCSGLIPTASILAATGQLEASGHDPGARLAAAGWIETADGEDGVTAWSTPDALRTAHRVEEGPDHGWLIHRTDLPGQPVISAALTTPPGVIAALALTD